MRREDRMVLVDGTVIMACGCSSRTFSPGSHTIASYKTNLQNSRSRLYSVNVFMKSLKVPQSALRYALREHE